MNVALWILQIILGLLFIGLGGMKAFQPKLIQDMMPWASEFRKDSISYIGTLELLAGIGLIVPRAVDIGVMLTPLSAIGLGAVMFLATVLHIRRKEYQETQMPIILLFLLIFIAVGRL